MPMSVGLPRQAVSVEGAPGCTGQQNQLTPKLTPGWLPVNCSKPTTLRLTGIPRGLRATAIARILLSTVLHRGSPDTSARGPYGRTGKVVTFEGY